MLSIILATYNKEDCIRNVLQSICMQEVDFPFEVVIVDDNSPTNPSPLIKEFENKLNINYHRLDKNKGCKNINSYLLSLTKYDIVVHQSSDVIYTNKYILSEFKNNTKIKQPVISRVYNYNFYPDDYLILDRVITSALENKNFGRVRSGLPNPKDNNLWYLFLGSFYKSDLIDINYNKPFCDAMLCFNMQKKNFKPQFRSDLIGLHQIHPTTIYDCPLMKTCTFPSCRPKNIVRAGLKLPLYLGYESLKDVMKRELNQKKK